MEWAEIFTTSIPVWEIILRGTFTYLVLYTLVRLVGNRESASLGLTDVLVVVLIADATSTGMMGASETIGDGFLFILVILFWSKAIDALAYKFPWFRKLSKAGPSPLIKDGEFVKKTLRREFLTHDEVMGQLRLNGVEDVSQVSRAYIESNGDISILSVEDDEDASKDAGKARKS